MLNLTPGLLRFPGAFLGFWNWAAKPMGNQNRLGRVTDCPLKTIDYKAISQKEQRENGNGKTIIFGITEFLWSDRVLILSWLSVIK